MGIKHRALLLDTKLYDQACPSQLSLQNKNENGILNFVQRETLNELIANVV